MNRLISIFVILFVITPIPSQAKGWLADVFGGNEEGVNVFEGGQQYVRIVKQEKSAEGENQHPTIYSVEKLKDALSAITVQKESGIFNDEIKEFPFFAQSEISVLSSGLSRAFERAKANEDIIFVVIGRHDRFFNKDKKVIGGRAFIKDDKLNLIFGDVYRAEGGSMEQKRRNYAAGCGGCDTADLRTNPYIVGRRGDEHEVELVIAEIDGLERPRSDWLILSVEQLATAVVQERNKLPPALAREQARTRKEAAQLNLERRQMREEMARMRQDMKNGGGASSSQSLEERLATLKQLRRKELISDEEYQTKRKEILNDI